MIRATTISTTYEECRIFMEARFCKLDLVPCAALACYGASVLPFIPRALSSLTGVVLCFILTGIAGMSAILPRGASGVARFTAAIACSLATGIVGGLILTCLPSGLVQFNWVTYAFAMTLIAYVVARARGAGSPLDWKRPDFPTLNWVSARETRCLGPSRGRSNSHIHQQFASWSNAFHRSMACPRWPSTFSGGCDGRCIRYQKP